MCICGLNATVIRENVIPVNLTKACIEVTITNRIAFLLKTKMFLRSIKIYDLKYQIKFKGLHF